MAYFMATLYVLADPFGLSWQFMVHMSLRQDQRQNMHKNRPSVLHLWHCWITGRSHWIYMAAILDVVSNTYKPVDPSKSKLIDRHFHTFPFWRLLGKNTLTVTVRYTVTSFWSNSPWSYMILHLLPKSTGGYKNHWLLSAHMPLPQNTLK